MRTLPTNIGTESAKVITTPFNLVEAVFSGGTIRASTRQSVTYGGETFSKLGCIVKNLSESAAQVSFDNTDNSASALVLNGGVTDRAIDIYVAYGEGATFTADDVDLFFSGVMSHVTSITANEVVVQCTQFAADYTSTPRIYCAPPLCNFMPAAGTKFGDYVLEPSTR